MIPVLLDCDPGIDDAIALLLAAASPEITLEAVTTVAGNRPVATTADNASRLLALAGRGDVPVHAGCAHAITAVQPRCNLVHGEDGLGGVALPKGKPLSEIHAVDAIANLLLSRAPGTLTVIAVGPLTNLALAEIRHPGILRRAHALLVMGGAAFCPGNITPAAEFNFYADPVAAHVVVSAGAPLTLFGLDVTSQATMSPGWIASLRTLESRSALAAHEMLKAYAFEDPLLHDACPVAWLLDPSLFEARSCDLTVDWAPGPNEGHLTAREAEPCTPSSPPAQLVTGLRAGPLFELVARRLARLP
jgi:purine nucleosidase